MLMLFLSASSLEVFHFLRAARGEERRCVLSCQRRDNTSSSSCSPREPSKLNRRKRKTEGKPTKLSFVTQGTEPSWPRRVVLGVWSNSKPGEIRASEGARQPAETLPTVFRGICCTNLGVLLLFPSCGCAFLEEFC